MNLSPELDLQVEIDRLAIENFVRKYSANMVQVLPNPELDARMPCAPVQTPKSAKAFNSAEDLKRLSNKSLESMHEAVQEASRNSRQNHENLKSASNKTIDSAKSSSKKKIK